VGLAFCAALGLVPLLYESPPVLAAGIVAVTAAGIAAGVGGELGRAARLGIPLVVLLILVNTVAAVEGDTLLFRGGQVLGHSFDVSLEELAAGGAAGLRVLLVMLAFGLMSAAVDPDDAMRLFRRVSYRSALTAALATRLVPTLARDAARMSDAARCRPEPPSRAAAARAAIAGSLERAVDLAAALEVRGYAGARRPAHTPRRWSRHDVRVALAAAAIALVALAARLAGVGAYDPYPSLSVAFGPLEAALAGALVALALAPLAGRAARLGVARA
jgi:energy-coupling factor transporter transmembrane protein EcfT